MAGHRYLKKGTLVCPRDKAQLHWETRGGMRIVHQQDGRKLLQAKCPTCGFYWGVNA